jgi:PKD repeat protein
MSGGCTGQADTTEDGEASATVLSALGLAVDPQGSLFVLESTKVRKIRNYPPQASISCTGATGRIPLTTTCTQKNTFDPNGSIIRWTWSPTDTGPRTSESYTKPVTYTHTYRSAGTYVVSLTVMDDSGATKKATQVINANP